MNGQALHLRNPQRVEGERLDELVAQVLCAPDLDALLYSNQGFFPRFMALLSGTLEHAFEAGDQAARHQAHRALFFLYEENFEQIGDGAARNQFHPFVIRVRNDIERAWERFERNRIDVSFDRVPADAEGFSDVFRSYCAGHRLTGHPLFDFIEQEATREEIVRFFAYDSSLVLRFCDLITLSMIGADDSVRSVLAENFWDEMGNGDFSRRHTYLFKRLLSYVGTDRLLPRTASRWVRAGRRSPAITSTCTCRCTGGTISCPWVASAPASSWIRGST